jgi:uncharacterized membrane protein
MSWHVRRGIIALAVVGFVSSAVSIYVHYQLTQNPGYTSFCDISERVNCTQVYLSRFGSVRGIPVALLGAFWFGLVLLLTVAVGGSDADDTDDLGESIGGYLLVLSTVGLAVVLFLGYASFMVLGVVCVLCVVVYVAVAGIFLLSGAAASAPMTSLLGRASGDVRRLVRRPAALGVAVVYLVVTAAVVAAFIQKDPPEVSVAIATDPAVGSEASGSEFQQYWDSQSRVELPVPRDGAQVLVLKFNDYECPSCAVTYTAYEPIFTRYESSHPGAIRQLNVDYPLDPECNEQAPKGRHMGACEAAVAVRLARRAGRDEELVRWLYENQQALSRDTIREALVEVAGMTDFDELYDTTLEDVKSDIALAVLIQIDATPTFVINGVMIKGGLQPQFFDAAIALELDRAASAQ